MAYAILTTMILGIVGSVGVAYNDVQAIKAREPLLIEMIKNVKTGQDRMHEDIREIRGFIIQQNNVKILKRGK